MGRTSRAQNLKFRAQDFDLHRSDPQRSGTPESNRFEVPEEVGEFCCFRGPIFEK